MNQDLNDENLVKRGILIRVGGGRGVEIFSKINKWGGGGGRHILRKL